MPFLINLASFLSKNEKHAGFKMNPRVKLHFINKLKTK